jgi:hypothetical protein
VVPQRRGGGQARAWQLAGGHRTWLPASQPSVTPTARVRPLPSHSFMLRHRQPLATKDSGGLEVVRQLKEAIDGMVGLRREQRLFGSLQLAVPQDLKWQGHSRVRRATVGLHSSLT